MERHVDARHQHERRLAAIFLGAAGRVGLQVLQAGDRAGDRVLLAGEVVVHDLQKLAGRLGDGLDVFLDVRVVDAELVRTQRAHAVVRAALGVALDQVVHGGAAVEHQFQLGFQRDDVGERGQRVVLAERVAREVRRPDVGAGLAQTRGLGVGHRGERHLRELGEVEQAVRVTVGHAVGGELLRVVAHDREDREAQLGAGQLVGALPHAAGGGRLGTLVKHHTLFLDALAGVDERGLRRADQRSAARDQLTVDAAGHFECHAAVLDLADALDGDLHLVVELHHAVHVVGPACDLVVSPLVVQRLDDVLGGGGQPHAVHQRGGEPGDAGAARGGVDRIEVAGGTRECSHVIGRGDGDAAQQTARRGLHRGCGGAVLLLGFEGATVFGGVGRQRVGVDAAANGEALGLAGEHGAVGGGVQHVDGHDAAGRGLEVVLGPAGERDGLVDVLQQLVLGLLKLDEVVEMHRVEQSLDDRVALDVHGAERRVDRRPCRADQRVGGDVRGREVLRQRAAGGRLVVVAEVGGQRVGGRRGAERVGGLVVGRGDLRHVGQLVAGDGGVADACGGGEHRVDVADQALAVDDRQQAGFGAAQRQRDDDVAHGVLGDATVRIVVPVRVEMDVEVVFLALLGSAAVDDLIVGVADLRAVCRVRGQVVDPGDVRAGADERFGALGAAELAVGVGGGTGLQFAGALQGRGLETAEDVGDGLVDGGDAGHGDRAGNHAHGIGGIAGVLGLPQLILAPPAQQVIVDDRHERHGLGIFAHEYREPSHIGRGHVDFGNLRVGGFQLGDGGLRIGGDIVHAGEQRGELAGFLTAHTGFDALQQVQEAQRIRRVDHGEHQVDETLGPLDVGHRGEVAEVRLGGGVERLDDLVAAAFQLFGVLHDAHQQTTAGGGGVLDLVDVGVKVAQAGGDSAD